MKTIRPLIGAILLLAGCNVGPKYAPPKTPSPPAYKEVTPAAYSTDPSGTWQPAQPQDSMLKGKWWEVFNEPELNSLEEQVNINNQNVAQYFQNFMSARALVSAARANLYPTVTGSASLQKSGTGKGTSSSVASTGTNGSTGTTATGSGGTFYSLPIDVSWQPDLWGRVRNTVHEYQYAAQLSAADLENERLSEQANLAEYFFELRGQDALQDLYNKTIEAYKKALELTQTLVDTGIDSPEATAEAEVTLKNAEATATGIATNRAIYEHAIATLVGKPAPEFSMPVKGLATEPPAIPIGVPTQLLQRRPDIAAAERTMAEANAVIGIQKAAYYPTVSLTGGAGFQSSAIAKLFSLPGLFWSLGASATETIFDAGLRRATVEQYTAAYNADVAAYRQTILTAFQQVEDYLASLRTSSAQIIRQREAVASAQRYVNIATARYQTGLDPYLNVITAQTTLLSDQEMEITLRVSEMTAAVQLVQALGGGWDASQLPGPSEITSPGAVKKVSGTLK